MKIFTIISLLLLSTLLLGCLNSQTSTNSTTDNIENIEKATNFTHYESTDFSINYPNNWKLDEAQYPDMREVTFTPVDAKENDTRGVTILVTKITPEDRALATPKLNQETKTNEFVQLISSENVQFAGQLAFKTVFLINAQAVQNTTQVDYVLTKEEKQYKISYLYQKDDSNAAVEIEQFIQTLQTH